MDLFNFFFLPRFPKGLADPIIHNHLKRSLPDTSTLALLKQSFWDTWSGLCPPDYMVNLLAIWPYTLEECENCQLWEFLVNDILTSSLVFFRHSLKYKPINLSSLINLNGLEGSYSDYTRNVKHKVPPLIKTFFNIGQKPTNAPYQIKTAYPNLAAAIIAGVGKSPLSARKETRNSLMQNLSFSKICLESISNAENISQYPAEELYIFERLFSIEVKVSLFDMAQKGRQYPKNLMDLVLHMPNVFSRLIFTQALFDFPEPRHNIEEESFTSGWLKIIGGYIFPVWQTMFCLRLMKKYRNSSSPIEKIIQSIEELPFYNPQEIHLLMMQKLIDKKPFYLRGEKEQYSSFVEPWDTDWTVPMTEFVSKYEDSFKLTYPTPFRPKQQSALLMSPLMDFDFLSDCINPQHCF